ncbi:TRAP transporter small permease subunit [Litoricolaceae bacterium]|jgi:TRAP-type C4-dicarboxylate transport system permease small subunit|nr:TRAP transporter small permease subunit [Litorivicinaceae bacterium]
MMQIITICAELNDRITKGCLFLGGLSIVLMVAAILVQVVFRYGFNNALPWPDEAARFCMLWMVGFMAPVALRRGGFVAVDALAFALPRRLASMLNLLLILIASVVVFMAVKIGWSEVTGFSGRFATAALYVPLSIDFSEWFRVPRSWMMASILFGFAWMLFIQFELFAIELYSMITGTKYLPSRVSEEGEC